MVPPGHGAAEAAWWVSPEIIGDFVFYPQVVTHPFNAAAVASRALAFPYLLATVVAQVPDHRPLTVSWAFKAAANQSQGRHLRVYMLNRRTVSMSNSCGLNDYYCFSRHGECGEPGPMGPCRKPRHHKGPHGKSTIKYMDSTLLRYITAKQAG